MLSNKSNANSFFTDIGNETWQCRCGRKRKQSLKRGYGNLMEHIRSDHPNYIDEIKKRANPIVSKLAQNRYGWLEWIVVIGFPFSLVENEVNRRYTKLEPISRRTL